MRVFITLLFALSFLNAQVLKQPGMVVPQKAPAPRATPAPQPGQGNVLTPPPKPIIPPVPPRQCGFSYQIIKVLNDTFIAAKDGGNFLKITVWKAGQNGDIVLTQQAKLMFPDAVNPTGFYMIKISRNAFMIGKDLGKGQEIITFQVSLSGKLKMVKRTKLLY